MGPRIEPTRDADNLIVQPVHTKPGRFIGGGSLPKQPALREIVGPEATAPARRSDARETPMPGSTRARAEHRRVVLEQRRARNDAHARVALALVGVSVVNAFAPLWGPALANQTSHPTRGALERILAQEARIPAHGVLSTLDARCLQLRQAPLLAKADTTLQAVDQALQLPPGTARTLTVERALVEAGVAPEQARDAAHLAAAAHTAADLVTALKHALEAGRVDLESFGLHSADAIDKMLADPHLAVAFAAGVAIAPRIPTPNAKALTMVGHVGQALLNAKLRHDHAIGNLKSLHTGNPVVDVGGRVAGELADLAAFTLAFLGPAPFLAAAGGTDLLLIAAHVIAAKTAVAGTLKAVGSFSDIPAEIVAFALGAAAEGAAEQAVATARQEAGALDQQRRTLTQGAVDAVSARDPQRAIDAVLTAWQQATPGEQDVLRHLVMQGAERLVTEAGPVAAGGLVP